jgi:hypothetical protein
MVTHLILDVPTHCMEKDILNWVRSNADAFGVVDTSTIMCAMLYKRVEGNSGGRAAYALGPIPTDRLPYGFHVLYGLRVKVVPPTSLGTATMVVDDFMIDTGAEDPDWPTLPT